MTLRGPGYSRPALSSLSLPRSRFLAGAAALGGLCLLLAALAAPALGDQGFLNQPPDPAHPNDQASRSPDDRYRTAPLAGRLFNRTRGFYHHGRFASLPDVVNHYDNFMRLGLSQQQKSDPVEYLKSI